VTTPPEIAIKRRRAIVTDSHRGNLAFLVKNVTGR
jgi:hypothetical protein